MPWTKQRLICFHSAIVGLVRSYGAYLPEEGISMSAVAPNVVRTAISSSIFYDMLEEKGLLTPMQGVLDAFESLLGESETSGEVLEVGPRGGFVKRDGAPYLDEESERVCDALYHRGHKLQEPMAK